MCSGVYSHSKEGRLFCLLWRGCYCAAVGEGGGCLDFFSLANQLTYQLHVHVICANFSSTRLISLSFSNRDISLVDEKLAHITCSW